MANASRVCRRSRGDKPRRRKLQRYPIGFFHIGIAEGQTAEGKQCLFVGIDRTARFAVSQLIETANRRTARKFLQHMPEAVPCLVHTILTDSAIRFAEQPRNHPFPAHALRHDLRS